MLYTLCCIQGDKTMIQWYVKDISKLTGVSVQTLHHYDHFGLLQPSIRLPNGYRVYSEKDLLKLQQIIALKYFGFCRIIKYFGFCVNIKIMTTI